VDGTGLDQRPVAPAELTEPEREVWQQIVNDKPSDWFGSSHVPMLVDYVTLLANGRVVAAQIKAFDPEWLATDEGLRRYQALVGMSTKLSTAANTLARSMRLTHQAIYRADKAGMTGKGRKLWQREPD
jgi:hypothetical protein